MNWHDIVLDGAFFVIKSPFRNLWPLAVAPAFATVISDRTARLLPRTPSGSIPAAALAAIPGLVGLVVIMHAINIDPVTTWRGVVAHRLIPLVATALLGYAIFARCSASCTLHGCSHSLHPRAGVLPAQPPA